VSCGPPVQWLEASDPVGERWSDVNVLAADLTSDGVAELLVGLAHPVPAIRGSVIA
jgi:hypothetical protein